MKPGQSSIHKLSLGGLLVTLGIIYGDIGTSPLYVLKAIIGNEKISHDIVVGGVSCIIWTLTLQTTVKYVLLTLRADNKGEGGIFSLYTLVKRLKIKWLLIPAVIGGSALLADGIITPSISVSSAVEGLWYFNPTLDTFWVVVGIITALFAIQQFGTNFIGKFFGPIMFIWFTMLGILGVMAMHHNPEILKAFNPYYAINLLIAHKGGIWILGAVFLCTTGAEGLYSDLGHCGKSNIRVSWIFVKSCLIINYLGQGSWLLDHEGKLLGNQNPFYSEMPPDFLWLGIVIATAATIVASQALITASFTLINEAMRLNLWPKVKIKYPTELRGQMYIPSINWLLWLGCIGIVWGFRESKAMEAAYGLTINLDMIMTSTLLVFYMRMKKYSPVVIVGFVLVYATIELSFLGANLRKFLDGGYVSLLIGSVMVSIMLVWHKAKEIRGMYIEFVKVKDHASTIDDLAKDTSIPKYATHLVYLTGAEHADEIEAKVIYSILQKRPKRADVYWFVHVNVKDEPYKKEYKVTKLYNHDIIRVDFNLGFRIAPRVNLLFRKVVSDLVETHEVDITSRYESLSKNNVIGDFKFIVLEKFLSYDNDLPVRQRIIMDIYSFLKRISLSEGKAFGLDSSSVKIEKFPLIIAPPKELGLVRTE